MGQVLVQEVRRFPKAYFIGLIENTGNSIELAAEKKISTKIKKGVYENENHEGLDQGVYVKHSTFRWGRCASPGMFFSRMNRSSFASGW